MKQITKSILLILSGSEKRKFGRLIVADLLIAVLDVAFLGMLLLIINLYTQKGSEISFLPEAFTNDHSLLLLIVFLLLFSIKNMLGFFSQKSLHHFFYDVASRLSKRNIRQYLMGPYSDFVQVDSSVHTRKISQQPVEFSHYILSNFQQMIAQSVLILFSIGAILWYRPTLFVLLFVLLLPPVALLAWFVKGQLAKLRGQIKTASERAIQHLNESLSGYVESNVYGKGNFFTKRYHGHQQQLNQTIAQQQTWLALPSRLMEIFAVLGFFILVVVNKYTQGAPGVSVLTISVFMAAAYKIIPGMVKIMNSAGQMKTYGFILNDLVNKEEIITADEEAPVENITSITFKKVSFSYGDDTILKRLDLELLPGDIAGISAPSGKGKTTLINLLLGFLEPQQGSIGINHKTADRQQYRKNISLVKQQPFFIHDTILKNITLSDEPHDEKQLHEALAFCGLDTLLAQYPEGLNKRISENGKNISGGQRQRVALARTLYHDFDLLILDEPFSEMDAEAESFILERLQCLAGQGKMVLLITHNKASLAYCNKIILPHGA